MLAIRYSTKFKKDLKLCQKRGYNLTLLQQVIDILRLPAPLPLKNREHLLSGNLSGYSECHISPDWLLIYEQTESELLLVRTGTHSDLFNL